MKLKITVHGVAYEVEVEVLDPGEGFAPPNALPQVRPSGGSAARAESSAPPPRASAPVPRPGAGGASARSVASPIAGTVVEIKTRPGESVSEGQVLLVVEAMKMNTSIAAPAGGTIKEVKVSAGDAVREGQVLVEFEE